MAQKIFFLAAAGALGTLARYGCGVLVERHATGLFPWPTLLVNMTGCFLFGLLYSVSENQIHLEGEVRVIVQPDHVTDLEAISLSREIKKKIEQSIEFPGQIKITVIRETRSIEYAR